MPKSFSSMFRDISPKKSSTPDSDTSTTSSDAFSRFSVAFVTVVGGDTGFLIELT